MPIINLTEISKTISHALRHEPWNYDLELDEHGWVNISQLISSISEKLGVKFDENTIIEILNQSEKKGLKWTVIKSVHFTVIRLQKR